MAASNNLHEIFAEMLEKQEQTDVIFKLIGDSSSPPEIFCAHKFILSAVSPVFKRMISTNCGADTKIEVRKVEADLFEKFIKVIYTNRLPDNAIEPNTVASLYDLAHTYETNYALDLCLTHMIQNCNTESVIIFANIGWIHDDIQLKRVCEKVFAKYAMKVLSSPEFLSSKPAIINAFYSLDALNVDSEDVLVQKLDEYIMHNKVETPDIIDKLKLAIKSIRILLVTPNLLEDLVSGDYKNALNQRWRDLVYTSNLEKIPSNMKRSRRKITLLSFLPVDMLEVLYRAYSTEGIFADLCCERRKQRPFQSAFRCSVSNEDLKSLIKIYEQYKHVELSKYKDEDIEAILEIFKRDAICKGDRSPYTMFLNYEEYFVEQKLTQILIIS